MVVVLVTPASFFIASFIAKRTYNMFKKQSEARGEQTSLIDEMIGNEKIVQAYSMEDNSLERFDEINGKLQKYSLDATFFSSLSNPSTRFVNNVVYALVAFVGAFSVMRGGLTVGSLSALLSYANQYMKPFNEISGVVSEPQAVQLASIPASIRKPNLLVNFINCQISFICWVFLFHIVCNNLRHNFCRHNESRIFFWFPEYIAPAFQQHFHYDFWFLLPVK